MIHKTGRKELTTMNVEKIYFDMDGVLADFNRGVIELGNAEPRDQAVEDPAGDNRLWDAVRKVDHFYDRLEIMPGAKEMFQTLLEKYPGKCEILTGIPKKKRGIVGAGEDKIAWIRRLFSPDMPVHVVYKEEKQKYCHSSGCILIDDLVTNIEAWRALGGTGILHVSPEDTMRQLKELGVL